MQIPGIDEIDNRILDIIRENARLTYKEIGDQVGISRVSVKTRMDALQEKGIIKGFHTIIDPTGLPEGIRFFLDVECTPDTFEDMAAFLADSKMIRQVYSTSGDCRLHAIGYAPNTRNLEYFVNTLYRREHGVRHISCRTVLSTLMDVDGGVDYVRYQKPEHMEG